MAKYVVIKDFTDLQDGHHVYKAKDPFPRKGTAKKERIDELSSDQNKRGEPLIKEVEEDKEPENAEYPKHTGGGYYELSNGEKVQGKEKAIEAEKALHE